MHKLCYKKVLAMQQQDSKLIRYSKREVEKPVRRNSEVSKVLTKVYLIHCLDLLRIILKTGAKLRKKLNIRA